MKHNSRSLNCISATCVKTAGNSGIELSLMELREGQRTQSDMVYSAELNLILIWGLIADKLSNKGVRTLWLHTQRKRERHCCTFIRSCSVLNTAGFFVLLLSCIFVLVEDATHDACAHEWMCLLSIAFSRSDVWPSFSVCMMPQFGRGSTMAQIYIVTLSWK